eukprot:CAMPEP_0194703600 /NCGR_PEP_ID=MMETSP0295-20121207/27696_1 /TAXON_ID=39354 /ORGANISM="Heterosigma akashiwo, Strain CCMP2393" /LENGTH=34 /DNA_ID= /DNA_START= /DNA_END= /DNA_ORIENTATION=
MIKAGGESFLATRHHHPSSSLSSNRAGEPNSSTY